MPDRKEIFKELEHEIQYYSQSTQKQYRAHVSDYLDWLKDRDWRQREVLYAYLDVLKKTKSQTYINYIVRGPIGCLFRMYGLRLPVKLPRVNSQMINLAERFSYSEEEIKGFIKSARASGNPQWQNLMALSTTYGLRVGELFGVRKDDVHPYKHTIVIHTEKGGMLREHLVPEVIAPYVFHYDYPTVGYNRRFEIFRQIAGATGLTEEEYRKKGYHGIRHGLITILLGLRDEEDRERYNDTQVYQFVRWKGGSMLSRYETPNFQKLDKQIFQHHPFLKEWV
jgi:integrase